MSFRYISAGVTPEDLAYKIFVKYEENNVTKIEHKYDKKDKLLVVTCPDRTIYISEKQSFFPASFDEYLTPNPYEYGSVTSKYTDHILFSAHNWKKARKVHRDTWCSNPNLKVVIDSGGAQLRFGTSYFVNPKKVMDVYNKAADIGLALDVPPRPIDKYKPENLAMLAEQQRRNADVFRQLYTKDRKVMFKNVLHGFDLEQHRQWIKVVDDEFFDAGWAIGFDSEKMLSNIINVFHLIEYAKKTPTDKIHFLGASGKTLFPLLAWFGKYIPQLTCDSSQHVHTAIRARLMEYFAPDGKNHQFKFGSEPLKGKDDAVRIETIEPNLAIEIPSGNPLMHSLKYAAVFGFDTCTGVSNILSAHNLINNARISKWWVERAENCTIEQYEKVLHQMFKKRKTADNIIKLCKVIDYCHSNGWAKALKHYEHLLRDGENFFANNMESLFGQSEKRASMENLATRNSSVIEVLPNYMSYKELKPLISKEDYSKTRIRTLMKNKRFKGKKITFEEAQIKYKDKIFHAGWSLDEELKGETQREENRAKKANRKKRIPKDKPVQAQASV